MDEGKKQELIAGAVELARHRFVDEQFNCAESAFWGITQALNLPVNAPLLRAVTPFGGGFGDSRATCGALVAGAMALGVALGRTELHTPRKLAAYAQTQKYYQNFVARAGGDTCAVINKPGFDDPDLRTYCARFVALATELAADVLLSYDPASDAPDLACMPAEGTGD